MFNLLGQIPKQKFAVACSGGIDSMVLVDFLSRFPKNHFSILYFNHGTEHGKDAENFLKDFCGKKNLEIVIGNISKEYPGKGSLEEYWRDERYNFLEKFQCPILTAHNLNDCVETWMFSSIRGFPKIIPYRRNQVIRPFLMVSKKQIKSWANRHNVEYIEDPSNTCVDFSRNLIRHELIPIVEKINPGVENMLKKMIHKRGTM